MFPSQIQAKIRDFPEVLPPGVTKQTDVFKESFSSLPDSSEDKIAVPIPGSKEPGYSPVYRNAKLQEGLLTNYHPDVRTVYDALQLTVKTFPQRPALGKREYNNVTKQWSDKYVFRTYEDIFEQGRHVIAGVANLVEKLAGRSVSEQYIIGSYMPNCPQWVATDIGAITQSLPSVCLYDTLGPDTTEYILNFCEVPVVVCSVANISKLLAIKNKLPKLALIVSSESLVSEFDRPGEALSTSLRAWGSSVGVEIKDWNEVIELGKAHPIADRPPKPSDIYAINFTSGTTGKPKGAILLHRAIVASISADRAQGDMDISQAYHLFSFLPLAHIFERMCIILFMSLGGRISFPHGSVLELMDDIAVAKPEMIDLVPRVLNRIAGVLRASTIEAPGLMGVISRQAYASKVARLRATGNVTHPLWDRVWSNKIKKKLGFENLKYIISGSAPLSGETIEFLKAALGIEVLQGYGLTESLSGLCVTPTGEKDVGTVGAVCVAAEIRLRDVPELNYTSSDQPNPRGEILLRGPRIFAGYYKNPEKTDEAFDKDGWFYTGDVGEIDSRGRIKIIDRVKNFFKLAQGEYIAAEKIENIYIANSSLINQIFVHGDSHQTFLVAVCAINADSYAPWINHIQGTHISATDLDQLAKTFSDPSVRRKFVKQLNDSIPSNQLQGFERVKNVILAFEPMTIENNCLTPTLKIIRPATAKYFQKEIDALYKEGPIDKPGKPKL